MTDKEFRDGITVFCTFFVLYWFVLIGILVLVNIR